MKIWKLYQFLDIVLQLSVVFQQPISIAGHFFDSTKLC